MIISATETAAAKTLTSEAASYPETLTAISASTTAAAALYEIQTQTQNAVDNQQGTDFAAAQSLTALANSTATQTAYEIWYSQHQFTDEFLRDNNGWTGDSDISHIELNRDLGQLIYETDKKSRNSFWRCDLCLIPEDYDRYSFEVKYFAPNNTSQFNFGFLFGCTQFDELLVSCQGVQIQSDNTILILQTGAKIVYRLIDYQLQPNQKGLISIRFEVRDQTLTLWINDQLVAKDINLNNSPGGMFGLFQDPAGSTVAIERLEILPLP